MLDSRIGRSLRLALWLGIGAALTPSPAWGDLPPGQPFVVPRDRAEWDARRPELWKQMGGGVLDLFPQMRTTAEFAEPAPLESRPDVLAGSVRPVPDSPNSRPITGQFLRPTRLTGTGRLPLVVLLVDPCPAGALATTPGWDGRPPALVLVEMGFAVLMFDDPQLQYPIGLSISFLTALDGALARPEIDPPASPCSASARRE